MINERERLERMRLEKYEYAAGKEIDVSDLFDRPRCQACGGFLSLGGWSAEYNYEMDCDVLVKQCRRCGEWNIEAL